MTRRVAALVLGAACAGCAATNAGGSWRDDVRQMPARAAVGSTAPAKAAPDSVWLTFTVPALGSPNGCEPDTTLQHDARTVDVLRLNTVQPPNYRRGCEADTACWDSVKVWNVPALVARLERLAPGQRCSVRVAAGLYTTITSNGVAASCWSRGARVGQ